MSSAGEICALPLTNLIPVLLQSFLRPNRHLRFRYQIQAMQLTEQQSER